MTYGLVDASVSLDLSSNNNNNDGNLHPFQPSGKEKSNPIPLFDPTQPQSPHSSLVPHFIQVFVNNLGAQCPFITYDDALERFLSGILPPLLANSIASLAARFVISLLRVVYGVQKTYINFRFTDLPDLVSRGVDNVSLAYGEKAKVTHYILPSLS